MNLDKEHRRSVRRGRNSLISHQHTLSQPNTTTKHNENVHVDLVVVKSIGNRHIHRLYFTSVIFAYCSLFLMRTTSSSRNYSTSFFNENDKNVHHLILGGCLSVKYNAGSADESF